MKQYLLIIFVFSLLPFISIFITQDLPHTSDGAMHLARIASYYKEVKNGQFPVRWAGELNYGYGTPLFNFTYPVVYAFSLPFVAMGFGLVLTLKILFIPSFLLSGIFMFLFARFFFLDDKKALLVAIFYQFAPFRLVEILVRGSLGGIFSYAFLPLVLIGVVLSIKKPRFRWFLLTSISTAILISSHNIIGFIFVLLSYLFAFYFGKTKFDKSFNLLSITSGLFLASFFLIPAALEHKYTYSYLFTKDLFYGHFSPLLNFFIPNFFNN